MREPGCGTEIVQVAKPHSSDWAGLLVYFVGSDSACRMKYREPGTEWAGPISPPQ